jgi:hypothetical protein
MARRRSREPGRGMIPLFDVEAFARPDDAPAKRVARGRASDAAGARETAPAAASTPVNYWVRGVFRVGDSARTQTVHAVGMSATLDEDVGRFVAYLTREGFQLAEGRGALVELLGVGADDGVQISLSVGWE